MPLSNSVETQLIKKEVERFESFYPSLQELYELLEELENISLKRRMRELVNRIEESFLNSPEFTSVNQFETCSLKLGVVGGSSSGKSALVHKYLFGQCRPDDLLSGRHKKEVVVGGENYILLIRDEGSPPDYQFTQWIDAVILVFSLDDEISFSVLSAYYAKMSLYRHMTDVPVMLVAIKDCSGSICIDDARIRKLVGEFKQCTYYEVSARRGDRVEIESVFQSAADKIVHGKGQSSSPVLMGYGELSSPPPKETDSFPATSVTFNMTPTNSGTASASSTPTSKRSIKRRTMLFSSKSDKKEITDTDVGSGRSIPLKQGFLYKRCTNSLNKEWKKKYATLLEKGLMIYYPSLNMYMDDVNGKIISLKHTTVKIPGKRPPKATSQASSHTDSICESNGLPENNNMSSKSSSSDFMANGGTHDSLNATVISNSGNSDLADNNTLPSVWTPFPTVPPPSPPQSGSVFRPDAKEKREKRNKRNKNTKSCEIEYLPDELEKALSTASMSIAAPASSRLDGLLSSSQKKKCEECEFTIVSLDGKSWHFEAQSTEERDSWVSSIEERILNSLQSNESGKDKTRASIHPTDPLVDLQKIREIPGNNSCVDCRSTNPDWASLNLGTVMCIECSGVHRNLGTHLSRVRSLDLDDWPHELIAVMSAIGNNVANSIWEAKADPSVKPSQTSPREDKEKWIRAKYESKEFLCPLPKSKLSLGMQLIEAVKSENIKSVIQLLAHCSAAEVNSSVDEDGQTALHVSCSLGNVVITQLLVWYNADVKLTDMKGRTALWYAQMTGSSLCSEVLINNGCKVTEINNVKAHLSFS